MAFCLMNKLREHKGRKKEGHIGNWLGRKELKDLGEAHREVPKRSEKERSKQATELEGRNGPVLVAILWEYLASWI